MYRNAAIISSVALLLLPELASGAGTTLRQTIMTELRYDTNARIAVEGQQSGDDFTLILSPGFQVINQREQLGVEANYRPTGYFYFQNSDLNTISHAAAVAADYKLSAQSSIRVEDRFTYTKESLDATATGFQNERDGILTNTINVTVNTRLSQKTGLTLTASDSTLNFEDPVSVDSRNDSASIAVSYQATPETQLDGSYNLSYVNYDLPNGANNSQNSHSVNAGFNTRFRETTTLLMRGGAVYADTAGGGDGYFDWLALAELRKTWPRYAASMSYTRRTTSSSGVTDQLTLNDSVAARLTHDINRNLNASVFGSFSRNHTKPVNTLDTKSFTVGASSTWRLRDWLSFGVGFLRFKQESDGPLGQDIERDHIFVNLHATTYEGRL